MGLSVHDDDYLYRVDRAWLADVLSLEMGLSVHDDDYLFRVDRAWWADVLRLEMGLSVHDDDYSIELTALGWPTCSQEMGLSVHDHDFFEQVLTVLGWLTGFKDSQRWVPLCMLMLS